VGKNPNDSFSRKNKNPVQPIEQGKYSMYKKSKIISDIIVIIY
jgi:hypothetical protein